MKDTIKYSEVCVFPNNIADVTSISLECNYECSENMITGSFLIEGSYRAYELSINQENFSYKLPFKYEFNEKVDEDSALVNINDFTYDIDNKELKLDIEYEVTADIIEEDVECFESNEEFDRFINENDVDIINLSDEVEEPIDEEDDIKNLNLEIDELLNDTFEDDTTIEELEEDSNRDNVVIENNINNVNVVETPAQEEISNEQIQNTIINNIRTTEDEYITYHIYVCTESDTIESISTKFKISLDELTNYNDIDNITAGVKLIIPEVNE